MITLASWIDKITAFELLDDAPHGFLSGCGGTSEFLNYLFRIKPEIDKYKEILQQHYYLNTAIDEKSFGFNEVDKFINCIDKRLDSYQYVRISFNNNNNSTKQEITEHIFKGYPTPRLFDHSFVLTKDNWRFESYLGYYGPRQIYWKDYKKDIKELFDDPYKKWEQLFNVKCNYDYDPNKITLIINN